MYFWRIEKLKTSMVTAPLTDREVLPYLIASVTLVSAIIGLMRHAPTTSFWDDISAILNIVIAILGTIYIYYQNNCAQGQHFLQRYIVISWVISIRWIVAFLVVFSIFFGILTTTGTSEENIALATFVFNAIASVTLYWRIGHHVHDLAQRIVTQ